ncbi:response regulator [Sediminibacterium roseum]|uniref:histidine kinase n=1 Tax=Sediminibacterium roseum TaxID=1978412 RepID=A0ABW9ZU73_9BACT|nr:response regulator [Sediminibacterium roseum]NCI49302.1 response regulator [Sediminibacterium roseum]
MNSPLKILILEDSYEDAEMVNRVLKKEGLVFDAKIAMSRMEYILLLDEFKPDLVLSDNSLPQFNAAEALHILREKTLYLPFILVTGTVSEEFAANIIKQGADDYILKDSLIRLPSAIDNALRQRRFEKEKIEAINDLRLSEENLNAIFQNTSEGFILADRSFIVKTFNNNAAWYVYMNSGIVLTEGMLVFDFLGADRKQPVRDILEKVLTGEKIEYDRLYVKDNNTSIWFHFSMNPVWKDKKVDGVCITARDITEQKNAENMRQAMEREVFNQRVQAQKEVTRALIKGQEGERNRIGQELHDNINQILAGTKMFLSKAGKDERLQSLIKYPMELLDKCMDEIRQLSHKHVTPLKDINLYDLVRSLLNDLERDTSITTEFIYHPDRDNGDDLNLNIYRIIQEQITNIMKHANATHVTVIVEGDQAGVKVMIGDNGQGFDVTQKRRGVGIANMINRIDLFNGEVLIDSSPGMGTRIRISIPY